MSKTGFSASLFLANEAETTAFGTSLAPLLQAGDTILLEGPIGAGKTHLARAIIQASLGMCLLEEDGSINLLDRGCIPYSTILI